MPLCKCKEQNPVVALQGIRIIKLDSESQYKKKKKLIETKIIISTVLFIW